MHPAFSASLPLLHQRRLPFSAVARRPPVRFARPSPTTRCATPPDTPDERDEHEVPQSAVDWNSEWSKFQEGGMRSMAPPGRKAVSKEEVAAAKARVKIQSVVDKVPSRRQLFSDWRFWVAIIASLSLFSAFVQSSSTGGGAVPMV